MQQLATQVHALGLKLDIDHTPWGIDYLKYDWGPVEAPETREMQDALRATHRNIVFNLSKC